jgi:hypothetical protein
MGATVTPAGPSPITAAWVSGGASGRPAIVVGR